MSTSQSRNAPKPLRAASAEDESSERLSQRVLSLHLPESKVQEGSTLRRGVWILGLLAAGAATAYFFIPGKPAQAPGAPVPAATAPPSDRAPQAETASSGDIVLECKGYVIPVHQILVSPKVSGMIVRLPIQEGMRVKKGDVLAELEDTDYRADYEHCVAALESCQAAPARIGAGLPARGNLPGQGRIGRVRSATGAVEIGTGAGEELITRKAISQQDLEVADSNYWAMFRRVERLRFALKLMHDGPRIERIDNARAEVRQAEADVAKAKWRLDNCTIRARSRARS